VHNAFSPFSRRRRLRLNIIEKNAIMQETPVQEMH